MVSGEKRNCEGENVLEKITTILLDIEGTTTSISFVKETLFPYVRENLKSFITAHWDEEEFKADLKALKSQAKKDEEDKIENFCPIEEGEKEQETLIKNVLWQMDLDRKTTALKQLQGHIWKEGYEKEKLKGHVYSDVAPMLKKWCEDGRKLYIYSSGSVEAQKLLFKSSESGDLTGLLSGYFDTEIGPKTEASSYTNIAKEIGCDCSQILFLTDVVKEAVAANKAGLQVVLVVREGNTPLTDDEKKAFVTVTSLKDLVFESSNKKKKICEEEKVSQETDKTENATKMEETAESEKMEVETNDAKTDFKEDCIEIKKTEEEEDDDGQPADKTESDSVTGSDDRNDTDSDIGGYIEISVSHVGNGKGEKAVSSSGVDGCNDVKKDETAASNGAIEETPEEVKKTEGETTGKEEENVDSTNETSSSAVPEDGVEKEKPDDNSTTEKKEEETSKETDQDENKKAHENGEEKNGDEKEVVAEVNGASGNGKVEEEISESVSLKKTAGEEQADSTVEVTA